MRHFSHDLSFVYPPKVETAIMQMFHQTIIFHAQGFFAINYTTMLQVEYECHYVIKVALFILYISLSVAIQRNCDIFDPFHSIFTDVQGVQCL